MTPALRLVLASAGAIYVLKAVALAIRRGPATATGLAAFLFAWPGVTPESFRERRAAQTIEPVRFLAAWARMGLAALSMVLLAVYAPQIPDSILGLAGIAALFLAI